MTLNTTVLIGKPCDEKEVFMFCRELLNCPKDIPFTHDEDSIRNPGGIGLDAWLWINYDKDPKAHECDFECDEDCYYAESPRHSGYSYVDVSFDTAYGFRGKDGESCSDLHAKLVYKLGEWLDSKDLPWKWQNEYTGEWFDRYDGLETLGNYHDKNVKEWFDNVVPMIMKSALDSNEQS